jgi:site-specific DNA recombinase
LETFLKDNAKDIDFLVFIKYDRFSRNLMEALQAIQRIENKYKIHLEAALEPIGCERNHPDYFKRRAQYLLDAEAEWHRIRDRTKFGIHEARSMGRHIAMAPFGYVNQRDIEKKPIIEIDPEKSSIIKTIFDQYMNGASLHDIKIQAQKTGFTRKGNGAIMRVLTNPTYAGLVIVPAYRDTPQRMIKGIHEGIIDEDTWREVQYRLGTLHRPKNLLADDAPLRGVLHCSCGRTLTAAESKGKSKWYWYYKCNGHKGSNYSALKLHSQFDEVLAGLSLPSHHIEYLVERSRVEMKEQLQERSDRLKTKRVELGKQLKLKESLDEKFFMEQVSPETYKKWDSTYSHSIYQLKEEISNLEGDNNKAWELFESELPKLNDMKFLFQNATLLQKQLFIRLVFDSQLSYYDGSYRTPKILPIFVLNTLAMKEKSLLIIDEKAGISGDILTCGPDENIIELSCRFLSLVAEIKTA